MDNDAMRIYLKNTIWFLLLWSILGCEDWDLPVLDFVVLQMEDIREEEQFLVVTSRITELRRETVDEYGHVWSRDTGVLPTLEENEGIASYKSLTPEEALTPFVARIDRREIRPKGRYVFRAYALIGGRCFYSESVLFYQSSPVVVLAESINYTGGTSANVEGRIIVNDPNVRVIDYGHCLSITDAPPPLEEDVCSSFGSLIATEESFVSSLGPLENGQSYSVFPYAVIQVSESETEICYGDPLQFEARLNQFWRQLEVPGGLSAREGAVSFTYGDSVAFIAGGLGRDVNELTFYDDCWRFSEATGWRPCQEAMPAPLAYGIAFTIGQKAYIGTGQKIENAPPDTVVTADFYAFDMVEESWEAVAPLPVARLFAVAFSDGEAGYVGTGLDEGVSGTGSNELWRYLPGPDRWEPAGSLAVRYGMVSLRSGEDIYVGGGFDERGVPSEKFWRYDGEVYEEVSTLDPSRNARGFAVGFSDATGNGFLSLGIDADFNLLTDVLQLPPGDETWRTGADFPAQGRIFGVGFSLQERLYMGLGGTPDGRPLDDLWVFTP